MNGLLQYFIICALTHFLTYIIQRTFSFVYIKIFKIYSKIPLLSISQNNQIICHILSNMHKFHFVNSSLLKIKPMQGPLLFA